MKVEKSLLSGSTPMLILSLLRDGDMYGYEMVSELARRSDNTFQLKEGTLYPLLHTMEQKEWITCYIRLTEKGRERKYYHLTEEGLACLETKQEEWRFFTRQVESVLGFPKEPAGAAV
ncbi:MAG: helix-turn-helix transcriptional regulator [Oscillospiraceae bacterium]|nr:helix-turn-helix transcriptional regulator [Oscillospiraceae bacterium]